MTQVKLLLSDADHCSEMSDLGPWKLLVIAAGAWSRSGLRFLAGDSPLEMEGRARKGWGTETWGGGLAE